MSIKIKLFASLADSLGRREATLEDTGGLTASDVWCAISNQETLPAGVLIAINMSYSDPESPITDGDEVAYFPPVTGGGE